MNTPANDLIGFPRRLDRARTVRDILRSAILNEGLGTRKLPSERELAIDFSTSRNVVREALAMLRAEGLIRRTQGTGTFPEAHWPTHAGERIDTIVDAVAGGAEHVRLDLIRCEVIDAPEFISQRLQVPARWPVAFVERLATLNGRPAMLTSGYLPAEIAVPALIEPGLSATWPQIREIETRLGVRLQESDVVFESVPADVSVARLLDCPPAHPLLLLERLLVDTGGRPIELSMMRCSGLRVSFARTPSNESGRTRRPDQEHATAERQRPVGSV